MEKVGKNDFIELLFGDRNFKGFVIAADLVHVDQRARLMISLVQAWGPSMLMAEAISDAHETQPHNPPQAHLRIGKLVMLASDVTDAVYDEIKRRQWMVEAPKDLDYGSGRLPETEGEHD